MIDKEASIADVMTLMQESDIRHVPVVEDNEPIGVISDRDLKVFENRDFADKFIAADIMVDNPYCVTEDTDLRDVVKVMSEEKYGSCLVKDEFGKVTGIFTMIDALRTLSVVLDKFGPGIQPTLEAK
jgi:CBS domain-containing protein